MLSVYRRHVRLVLLVGASFMFQHGSTFQNPRLSVPLTLPSKGPVTGRRSIAKTQLRMVFTAPEESVLEQLSALEKLDSILDECLRYSARRPIMVQFNPASKFIWRQWKGTVFTETWKSVARMAVWAGCVTFSFPDTFASSKLSLDSNLLGHSYAPSPLLL